MTSGRYSSRLMRPSRVFSRCTSRQRMINQAKAQQQDQKPRRQQQPHRQDASEGRKQRIQKAGGLIAGGGSVDLKALQPWAAQECQPDEVGREVGRLGDKQ